jgi:hypothetical protein
MKFCVPFAQAMLYNMKGRQENSRLKNNQKEGNCIQNTVWHAGRTPKSEDLQ